MRKSKFTEEQIIGFLKQAEIGTALGATLIAAPSSTKNASGERDPG